MEVDALRRRIVPWLAAGCLALTAAPATGAAAPTPRVALTGVNLAGAEFNGGRLPGRPSFDYVYPSGSEIAYFAAKGANVIRLPVLWERLQPDLNGPLDRGELDRLRATLGLAKRSDLSVVIDIHDYGGYRGQAVGSAAVPVGAFVDLWSRLAAEFPSDDRIIFGLMNEPIARSTGVVPYAQSGIAGSARNAPMVMALTRPMRSETAPKNRQARTT